MTLEQKSKGAQNMSDDVVAKADQALEGVTPGPWVVNREGWACISSGSDSVFHGFYESDCPACGDRIAADSDVEIGFEDRAFIAAARELVPALRDEVIRLRAENEQWRRTAESVADQPDELESYLMTSGLSINLGDYGQWGCQTLECLLAELGAQPGDGLSDVVARVEAETERLTEQLIDARIHAYTLDIAYHEGDESHLLEFLGMTSVEHTEFMADPRGFMRQKITEESRG